MMQGANGKRMKIEIHSADSDDDKGVFDFLEIRDKDLDKAQAPKEPGKEQVQAQHSPTTAIGPPEKVASEVQSLMA